MVPIMSLVAPILLSAVLVFIMSSLVHMVLGYHRADYTKMTNEDEFLDAVRKMNIAPGDYMAPCPSRSAGRKDPQFLEKLKSGPVVLMTVIRGGGGMGAQLLEWYLYCAFVGLLAAYISGRSLGPGAPYLHVFRFAGATAFIGYSVALIQNSIWYRRSWGTTFRYLFDGLVYGLLTGGVFGWLWPR